MQRKTSESDKLRQEIANLCTSIGNKSFLIRQAQIDINLYHAEIDTLRDKLTALEAKNGPKKTK